MKPLAVILVWLALTTLAARFVPDREQPRPIAYTRPVDDLQRDFPTNDSTPGQAAHWLRTVQLNTLSTQPRARSGPTTTQRSSTALSVVLAEPVRPQGGSDGCGGWRGLVDDYSWNVTTACRVLLCESGGRSNAVGPSTRYGTAKGLMQIMGNGSFDPATNMAQAWAKYQASGWAPWVCH